MQYLSETGKAKFLSAAIWLLLPLSHSLSRGDEDEKDDGNEQMKKHTIWLLDDDIYEDTHPFFLQTISQSERRISENP